MTQLYISASASEGLRKLKEQRQKKYQSGLKKRTALDDLWSLEKKTKERKIHNCTVPFSLFADPERILRRLYVFAEEPCKSNTTTSEPCSPIFKEAQPRPSDSLNLKYHINNLNLYLYVFGLKLFIIVIKSIQPDCDKNQRN